MLTGLRSDNIRAELRPLLKNKTTGDDELLETLSRAVADETEHLDKFKITKKRVDVSSTDVAVEEKKKESKNLILEELMNLKAHVMELSARCDKNGNNKPGKSGKPDAQKYRNRNLCDRCYKNGSDKCEHCFICFFQRTFEQGM